MNRAFQTMLIVAVLYNVIPDHGTLRHFMIFAGDTFAAAVLGWFLRKDLA